MRQTVTALAIALAVVCTTTGTGCFVSRVWVVDYELDPAASRSRAGEEVTLSTSRGEDDEADLIATDERAQFVFRVEPGRIRLSVTNRGSEPLTLRFAEATFVDAAGKTQGLHTFVDDATLRDPTAEVGPGATRQFRLWPEASVRRRSNGSAGVSRADSPLGGSTLHETSRVAALANRSDDVGKSFEIDLPIGSADERTTYRFRFTVEELVARRISWA
jgi:hypothetical protein